MFSDTRVSFDSGEEIEKHYCCDGNAVGELKIITRTDEFELIPIYGTYKNS